METFFSLIVRRRRQTVVLKADLGHFHKFIQMEYIGWMPLWMGVDKRRWKYILGGWTFFMAGWVWVWYILVGWGLVGIFYGWVGVGGGIFFLDIFMGEWGWVDVYFGWVRVSGGLFLGGWRWVELYFGWVGVGGHFLWASRGVWVGVDACSSE